MKPANTSRRWAAPYKYAILKYTTFHVCFFLHLSPSSNTFLCLNCFPCLPKAATAVFKEYPLSPVELFLEHYDPAYFYSFRSLLLAVEDCNESPKPMLLTVGNTKSIYGR
jgi:hypothetical protein